MWTADLHVTLNNLQLKLLRSRPPDVLVIKPQLFSEHIKEIFCFILNAWTWFTSSWQGATLWKCFLLDWYVFKKSTNFDLPFCLSLHFVLRYKRSNKPHTEICTSSHVCIFTHYWTKICRHMHCSHKEHSEKHKQKSWVPLSTVTHDLEHKHE